MASNITTGTFEEVMNRQGVIEDFSNNGNCSNCGGCCNDIIPLNNSDINRIKHYIKKHNIKPVLHNLLGTNFIDSVCPFRDEKNLKCIIYDVRPLVCRHFFCHNYYDNFAKEVKLFKGLEAISCRQTFFGEL